MKFPVILHVLPTALALVLCAPALPAAPVISEFLADNDNGLKDEDGNDEDWIEIHNPDATEVDLGGWWLTDDPSQPSKWVFPSRILPPDGRLIVFASEKDRTPATGNLHTNFKLATEGEYLALIAPGGAPTSEFSPQYPFQTHNTSYGAGYGGTVNTTDATPTAFTANGNYARVQLNGVGAAAADGSLNVFDDSLTPPKHQQYLWYDYSSRLNTIPAGQTVVQATLEWTGRAPLFAGVSGLNCVAGKVGVFPVPDAARGVTSIATGADGDDLIDWYAGHTPAAEIGYQLDRDAQFVWDVTALVAQWMTNPATPQRGQFILMTNVQPAWVAWDQNRPGPRLVVRTVNSPTPVFANGFMLPSPGAANTGVTPAGPLVTEVTENPPAPNPALGTGFVVTARVAPLQGGAVNTVTLVHRLNYGVEASILMNDGGTGGDATAGDGVYSATIPAASVVAGQMLRWKVRTTDVAGYTTQMPPYRNTVDSPQYFGVVPIDSAVATNLMLVHWFVQNPSAAATTTGTRCSVAFNGEFYDNVGINLHGQSTSGGAFLKKSYDIDGNRGYRFKWTDDPTVPRAKDINLLTIYADKTKIRHGLAYEMNREAGVPAHYCFPVRVQQNGAFNGIYDFVEDGDDVYLERAGLNKDGALYKMYNNMLDAATHAVAGAEKKNRKSENNADLQEFLNGMNLTNTTQRKNFLMDNVDIPKMINFMAGNSVTGNIDLHSKNYYIYRDSEKTNLWTLLAWDLDLSQGRLWTSVNNYFDDGLYVNPNSIGLLTGTGQGLVSRMYGYTDLREMAKRRIRTLHEMFWQRPATVVAPDPVNRWYDRRVLELQQLIGADATLDYNRYAAAAWKNPAPATTPSPLAANNMAQELDRLFANYVVQRVNFAYTHPDMPPAQNLAALSPLVFGDVDHTPVSGNQDEEFIEIRNFNTVSIDLSGWQLAEAVDFTFEPGTVVPGRVAPATYASMYVCASRNGFKARAASPKGGEGRFIVGGYTGHLSNIGETIRLLDTTGVERAVTSYPGAPSVWQESLVVSEVMYHPDGNGLAEFVELLNIGAGPLQMTGVRISEGVDFDFTGSPVTTIPAGGRVVVVRDVAAFQAAHGAGHTIAGTFANASVLDNAGEKIKAEDPSNNTVQEFTYDDVAPWPTLPDSGGFSLVLIDPQSNPDPADPLNWRASGAVGGNPGGSDSIPMPAGDPMADGDVDGLSALLEYALGTNPAQPSVFDHLSVGASGEGWMEVSIVHALAADDALLEIQISDSLGSWTSPPAGLMEETRLAGGMTRQTWRIVVPSPAPDRQFMRLRAVLR